MKVAIVGAGLTGLSCALSLKDHCSVTVFEKDEIGGLLSSICKRGYCIERFYHHCFKSDRTLIDMIKSLGLSKKLVWKVVRIGYAISGKIYPLNTPIEILRYPHLSLLDKIKLAIFTLRSRKRDWTKEDEVCVLDGIRRELGDRILDKFFMPLLKAKFGEHFSKVSYAWLLARVAIRSNRKLRGEELGYLRHGFHQLIERMRDELDIRRKHVGSIKILNKKFIINGDKFDAVVWTAPIPLIDVNLRRNAEIPDIKYQSSICVLISSEKSITDDIYWTNVDDAVFGAIIEHTHFMPFEDYGENLIYLASYSTPDGWLFNLSREELVKLYLKDVERFGLKRDDIRWIEVSKARYSSPIYETGYLSKITKYKTKVKGFYIAGLTSKPNYPERSMNGSIKAGREVAEVLKKDFGLS